MSSLLSIDPGLRSVGWAYWEGRELCACGLSRSASALLDNQVADHRYSLQKYFDAERRVCEIMVHRGMNSLSSPADLLKINIIAGSLGTEWVAPAKWKGHVPKSIHQKRILAAMDASELTFAEQCWRGVPSNLRHNIVDAIGIGLYTLGRLKRTK